MPTCERCGTHRRYCSVHDALFCPQCDVWLEWTCADADCPTCVGRPKFPSRCTHPNSTSFSTLRPGLSRPGQVPGPAWSTALLARPGVIALLPIVPVEAFPHRLLGPRSSYARCLPSCAAVVRALRRAAFSRRHSARAAKPEQVSGELASSAIARVAFGALGSAGRQALVPTLIKQLRRYTKREGIRMMHNTTEGAHAMFETAESTMPFLSNIEVRRECKRPVLGGGRLSRARCEAHVRKYLQVSCN